MSAKIDLFNRINDFIYASNLGNLKVFSKQYLHSIVIPKYSDNVNSPDYSIIFMDFDKLYDVNLSHGIEFGDKIIYDSLSLVKQVLPKDITSLRVGGDEFLFILQNCSKNNINNYIEKIYDILNLNYDKLYGVTATLYGIHSSEQKNLEEMINTADINITTIKNNSKEDSNLKWDTLNIKTMQNFKSFFNSLRLSNFNIKIPLLRQLYLHIINSAHDLLETTNEKKQTSLNEFPIDFVLSQEDLVSLDSLFQKENSSNSDIDKIDEDIYLLLLNSFIREPNTKNFSKNYFEKYLLNNCSKEYKVKYFSTTFVKLFNTLYSHNATDSGIKKLSDNVIDYLINELNVPICTDGFLSGDQNYFIDLGAGDFILALEPNADVSSLKINDYIKSQSSKKFDFDGLLKFTCSNRFKQVNKDNYKSVLTDLSNECKNKKNAYKSSVLNSSIVVKTLNTIIADSMEYFLSNIPNSSEIEQKNKYLNMISHTVLDIVCSLNDKYRLEKDNNSKQQKKQNNNDNNNYHKNDKDER